MTTTPEFTTRPYLRSHGTEPRGRGAWAFQESFTSSAFDRDLIGEVLFVDATYGDAKREARAHFSGADFVAVLP